VGFVVDEVALGQVFSEYYDFPFPSFHSLPYTSEHPSSWVGTIGQIVADVPSGLKKLLPKKLRDGMRKKWKKSGWLISGPRFDLSIFKRKNSYPHDGDIQLFIYILNNHKYCDRMKL
jgi:hypothetical protein